MFCSNCKRELAFGTRFCIYCGAEQPPAPPTTVQEAQSSQQTPARPVTQFTADPGSVPKNPKGRYMLFGAVGTAVGAVLLAVILLIAGVFSPAGKMIEGPGFATPEDAAKAYLTGLRDRNFDAMLASFAIETYVENYDFKAFIERLNAYTLNGEMRFPNTNDYTRRLNTESRKGWVASQIMFQYMLYNTPDALNNGAVVTFDDPEAVSDFVADFESGTEDYVFQDLKILTALSSQALTEGKPPEDLAEDLLNSVKNDLPEDLLDELPKDELENMLDIYMSENNRENLARQAKILGADIEDVANIVVVFEAGGDTWVFCPQAIRYNGRWYLQTLQGNVAVLAGMSNFMGGVAPVD